MKLFGQSLIYALLDEGQIVPIAFFASAVLGGPLLSEVLRWKPLVFVGVISYSIYLLETTLMGKIAGYILQHVRSWAASERSSLATWAAFSTYAQASSW